MFNALVLNKKDDIKATGKVEKINISDERILHMLQLKQPLVIQEISDLGSRRIEEIKNCSKY